MNKNSGFRLLAIRPLKDCHSNYLKNLKEGEIYQFYNQYQFIRKNEKDIHSEIQKIEFLSGIPNNFYSTESLGINISAMVGKNGSGKSSLLELFFALIYFIAIDEGMIDVPDDALGKSKYESFRRAVKVEIFYEIDSSIRRVSLNENNKRVTYNLVKPRNIQEHRENVLNYLLDENATFDVSQMFYSIAVNYSIYGLNSNYLGNWINDVFHKNDAYQTPLVINPMRSNGNFDINDENELLKYRLISNAVSLNENNELIYSEIAPFKKVVNLIFKMNYEKVRYIREEYPSGMNPMLWKFDAIFRHFGHDDMDKGKNIILDLLYDKLIEINRENCVIEFHEEVELYIIKKLHKIAMTYPDYTRFVDSNYPKNSLTYSRSGESPFPLFYTDGNYSFENFLIEIKKEKSHITFKLNQAINYLKNDILRSTTKNRWSIDDKFDISPLELGKRIKKIDKDNSQIINLIPPSLFDIEIEIKDSKLNDSFPIHSMSSGEQQMIHSIQSIVYHIRNINSVFNKNPDSKDIASGKKRITYESINIILDEIELYYHPDFQREYISNLLHSLKQIKFDSSTDKKVKNLNILFSTHSPFILSDIPSENVLRLKRDDSGKSIPDESKFSTFGANIFDLFKDSFFMEKGFIGEFARQKIDRVFNDLLEGKEKISDSRKLEIKQTIQVIGEPLIKRQLSKMYDEIYNTELEIEVIDEQIKRLENFKNRIQKKNHDKDK